MSDCPMNNPNCDVCNKPESVSHVPSVCKNCGGSKLFPDHAGIYRHAQTPNGAPLYCQHCVDRESRALTGDVSDFVAAPAGGYSRDRVNELLSEIEINDGNKTPIEHLSPAPAQEVKRYDNTSTGWLIEKGQLCIGSCSGGYKWVTFNDPAALKFPTELDAERAMFATPQIPRDCKIREHMWVDDASRLRSAYASLSAELERVKQERELDHKQKVSDFDLWKSRESALEAQLSAAREALGSAAHTMTIQANAAANGGGMGHIAVALREAAERARLAALNGGNKAESEFKA